MNNNAMMSQTKRLFDEVFTKGNTNLCDELMTNNVVLHDSACMDNKQGLKYFKELDMMYRQAFPNKKISMDDICMSNDKVIVRWTLRATQKGEFMEFPASNKDVCITGISIYRFENGKICEIWQS